MTKILVNLFKRIGLVVLLVCSVILGWFAGHRGPDAEPIEYLLICIFGLGAYPVILALFLFFREKDRVHEGESTIDTTPRHASDGVKLLFRLNAWSGCLAGTSGLVHFSIEGGNASTSVFLLVAGLGTGLGMFIGEMFIRKSRTRTVSGRLDN